MKVGLVGYSGSGKSTVFQWLTGAKPDPSKVAMGQTGVAKIPDKRLDLMSAKFNPKKTTFGTMDFLDTPGVMADERRDNPRRLGILRESGGLLVVLNCFNDNTPPAVQLQKFREELMFADLEIITNRIGKLETQLKKPKPAKERDADQAESDLLRRIATAFEHNQTPASLGLKDEEEKSIRSFQLLTLKPEMVLLNIGDDRINQPLPADLLAMSPHAVQAPAKLELELNDLPDDERQMFMEEMGIKGFVRDETLRAIFSGMGQMVFFTVGEDECRSWPLPKNSDAVQGAGQIHTDLAKRFVRAEVVSYEDFQRCGSMKEAKNQGVYRLEGKTYMVKDGDIMHIL